MRENSLRNAQQEDGLAREAVQTYKSLVQHTLNEQIYQQLKEKLITGEFQPGDRLVSRNLAATLSTSPVPVRDALQRLESLGALRLKRTFCVPHLTLAELTDIRDIRIALEGLSAERAAEESTVASVNHLKAHFEKMAAAAQANDTNMFLRANASFHLYIAQMSSSRILREMIEPLWLRMGPSVRLAKVESGRLVATLPEHERLLIAIAAKDAKAARKAVIADIMNCFGMLTNSAVE